MVHSAFRQLGRDGFRPDDVLAALVDYMGAGTLLLPTMSWRYVKPSHPVFDEFETPSNVGILTNLFLERYAERRSLHPTHSCAARGAATDPLLDGHHLDDTPCSANSPFGRLMEVDAGILMLGITMDCCTLIHHVEEIEAIDVYLKPVEETEHYTCRDRDGRAVPVSLRRHLLLHRNYWQFQDNLAAKGQMQIARLDRTTVRCFRARDMAEDVTAALRADPTAVLAKPGERWRPM
jgi:aminoglycoside 3-N-acetyltransferase